MFAQLTPSQAAKIPLYIVDRKEFEGEPKIEGKGYLVGTALHIPSKRTCVNIFKVGKLSDGPICRAWLPHHLPLGFHGNFITA